MGFLDDKSLFESGPVVLFKWRNAPGWPVEYVSKNVAEVTGFDADSFLSGRVSYASLIVEDDLARVSREVELGSASGEPSFEHEPYRLRRADGEVVWLYDHTHIVRDESGTLTHYLGYVFDITGRINAENEKKELERRFFDSQKLESLGLLAGGVAHDFNNLLAGIVNHAAIARRSHDNPLRLDRSLEQIEWLAQHAAELTRQLLAYSGKGKLAVEPVDLAEVVNELTHVLDAVLSKNAKFALEASPDAPAALADRTQMRQVVMNLLTNASEALDGTGTISIRTRGLDLGAETPHASAELQGLAPGRYVALEVRDSGRGMAEEARARVFEPFFTTKPEGRGLGLSAVHGIVRAHQGRILVESSVGKGTAFTVVLPASEERPVTTSIPPASPEWRGKGSVLVVDDERNVRSSVAMLLEYMGFEALQAEDGSRALEIFERHREAIVLVVLDMTMPGLSGLETMRALREKSPGLPVVLTSGYAKADAERGSPLDATAFLQKPYSVDDLERIVRAALPG